MPETGSRRAMRSYHDVVIEELRRNPEFAREHLRLAWQEFDMHGEAVFLMALRHLVDAYSGRYKTTNNTRSGC